MKGRSLRYTVILEHGETSWGAHVPDLPGCVAAGATREEALRLIREAIELHIDGLREEGLPVPEPRSEPEIVEIGLAAATDRPPPTPASGR
jgi:predicted RNase H-like HicB family nuclease